MGILAHDLVVDVHFLLLLQEELPQKQALGVQGRALNADSCFIIENHELHLVDEIDVLRVNFEDLVLLYQLRKAFQHSVAVFIEPLFEAQVHLLLADFLQLLLGVLQEVNCDLVRRFEELVLILLLRGERRRTCGVALQLFSHLFDEIGVT